MIPNTRAAPEVEFERKPNFARRVYELGPDKKKVIERTR